MARSRNIKPGFFRNDELVALPFEYRLLYAGLWTIADRAGRFEDRPLKIKMDVFPADNVDIDAGLQALCDSGFIIRYAVDCKRYCAIIQWKKHQNPHVNEVASTIPEPCLHSASTVLAPPNSERLGLIPSSLIPDSLLPDSLQEQAPAAPALTLGEQPAEPKPKKARKKTGDITFQQWIDNLGGADALPDEDPIFGWAEKQKIPALWIDFAWEAFDRRYIEDRKPRYADWRRAFRHHVEQDWLKIWRSTPHGPVLTTVGEQMRVIVEARQNG